MTDEQYKRLPGPFKDKIVIDRLVSHMKQDDVINFGRARALLWRQQDMRARCKMALKGHGNNSNNLA